MSRRAPSELALVLVIAAVQFINILDFMIVMPLGPDLSAALGIPLAAVGLIVGSYAAAAAAAGIAGSLLLDRYDRRLALLVALVGLIAGTTLSGLATGPVSLFAARMVAGAFGGPASALAMSIVADLVPPHRRGRAMGVVMGAFSLASVLGVPAGLWLALVGGWRLPFFAVAAGGALVAILAAALLPPLDAHRAEAAAARAPLRTLLGRRRYRLSWAMTAVVMMASFLIVPNLASYLVQNLAFPREQLGLVYLAGGALSFASMTGGGRLVDRFGSFRVGAASCAAVVALVYALFVGWRPWMPIILVFAALMALMALRNVAYNTLTSRVPSPPERARFMSIQSAVAHLSSGGGAALSALLLTQRPDGSLGGVARMAGASIALMTLVPVMLWIVERTVGRARGEVPTGASAALAGIPAPPLHSASDAPPVPPPGAGPSAR